MKIRPSFTPILAVLFGFAILFLIVKITSNKDKVVTPIPISKDKFDGDDTLLAIPPVGFDTVGSVFLAAKNGKEKRVSLNYLTIKTHIHEKIALTRYEMTFYNSETRNLEAELNFPLANGQTITSFAMDIDGKMRQGVAVEKEKARVAFETTIRKNIDPGLVEMTKSNNFKARVFPVPANGYKKIIIEVTEELKADTKKSYYRLPLSFTDKLKQFNLTVDVLDQEASPEIISTSSKDIQFKKVQRIYSAKVSKTNYYASAPLMISMPANSENKKAITVTKKGSTYFHTSLNIPYRFAVKEKPGKITVFWDVSASRNKSNLEKELDLMNSYLKYLNNVSVEFIPYANSTLEAKSFMINNGNTAGLESYVKSMTYDGGTILSDLPINKSKGEEILVFTDGLANLGKHSLNESNKKVYTIFSSPIADPSILEAISLKTNAESIDLNSGSAKDGLNRLKMFQLRFIGFEKDQNLTEYFPRKGSPTYGYLGVSGKLKTKVKKLTALFGYGDKVVLRKTLNLETSKDQSDLQALEKLWAIKKISHLNQNYKANKDQITELGIEHRLVTKNTSLLVLDRLDDYLEHEIVPPKELQDEYFKRLAKKELKETKRKENHLIKVYADFKEQKTWWNKKVFKKKKDNEPDANEVHFTSPDLAASTDQIMSAPPMPEESRTYEFNAVTSTNSAEMTVSNSTSASEKESRGAIQVQGWDPKSPYMSKIKKVELNKAYAVYLDEKTKYGNQPSFYLDVADYFIDKGKKKEGLRILSNIAELELENHSLLRILAHRLLQLGEKETALELFKDLIELRPEEPQSYRDLGLAYAQTGKDNEAIRYLYKVVTDDFDERFDGIQVIALNEINNIISRGRSNLKTSYIDKRFIYPMPVDIRVVLNWDADNTDVDLWVTDPRGEKCFYSNKYTSIGGRISNDFTQGYGPEEFMIRRAIPGKYKIQAHYYGSSSQSILGKATLSVEFFKQYGTNYQEKQEITRRLNVTKDIIDLGTFTF